MTNSTIIHDSWLGVPRAKVLNGLVVPATLEDLSQHHDLRVTTDEVRVRTKTRYLVTHYKGGKGRGESSETSEHSNVSSANEAARALAMMQPGRTAFLQRYDEVRIDGRKPKGTGTSYPSSDEKAVLRYLQGLKSQRPTMQSVEFILIEDDLVARAHISYTASQQTPAPKYVRVTADMDYATVPDPLQALPPEMLAAMRRGARATGDQATLDTLDKLGLALDA